MKVWSVSVAVMAACYSPTVPSGVACPDGVTCPNGQECIAGFCGGTLPDDGDPDAPDGSALPDAPIDATSMIWGVPTKIPQLSTSGDDYGLSISADGLTVYLNHDAAVNDDFKLFTATRTSLAQPFGALTAVAEADLPSDEYDADISIDQNEIVFISSLAPAGVRRMTRPSTTALWFGPMVVGLDAKEGPSLFANDLRMLVANSTTVQEYSRPNTSSQTWTFVRDHDELDSQEFPGVSADGLEVFTTRSGRIYRATRGNTDQQFGPRTLVTFGVPFDSYYITDPELSADGQSLYLSINSGGSSDFDIFVTTR